MFRDRYSRRTYGGHTEQRRPLYPPMLRRFRFGRRATVQRPRYFSYAFAALLTIFILVTTSSAGGAFAAYSQLTSTLTPRLEGIDNRNAFQTSRIFDRNGVLLYEFFGAGKRTKVALDQISPLLRNATIAIEDKTFYTNPGVDFMGIARTLISSLQAGEETGGASTITQQLIKLSVLTDEERDFDNRYQRKLKEIILAQEMDQRYSKDQILEFYLNEIFYGNLAYGAEAASGVYFNKSAKDLNLAEASLLAGLPQLPTLYNPIKHAQRDERGIFLPGVPLAEGWLDVNYALPEGISPPRARQIAVLRQMVDEGYATAQEARLAVQQPIRLAPQDVPLNAPHFVFYVRDLVEQKYGKELLNGGGLNITTTLDLNLQRMVQEKAAERIKELEERNIHNAAVVVMQPNTGQVLAMVGSIDYNAIVPTRTPGETGNVLDGQVNVTTRERQPGSALKPFTYISAMEQGMTPETIIWDVPTEFPIDRAANRWYEPQNYDQRWNGPVRIRMAVANSLNMPAVKALRFAGIAPTLDLLDRVGIKTGLKRPADYYGLALTLGGGEVTPLELTTAYNTLASEGRYYAPSPILKITDASGEVREAFQQQPGPQALDPALASIMTDMLSDDQARRPIWGLNSILNASQPAAVKTGTTNDWRDAWAVGYTPYVTVGVWTGNNNNETTAKVESSTGGGTIWRNVMEEIFVWIKDKPEYAALFGAPTGGTIATDFPDPPPGTLFRGEMCAIPGAFGGPSREFFTADMVQGATRVNNSTFRIRCNAFREAAVARLPGAGEEARFCTPSNAVPVPQEWVRTMRTWNTPPPDPDVRVEYRWQGGSATPGRDADDEAPVGNYPACTQEMVDAANEAAAAAKAAEEAAKAEEERRSRPPVEGAVLMPDLTRLGENQAKEVLARLGVTDVYVDYQGRDRIPEIYDQFLAYTVVSSSPAPGNWILPGTTVVLGIRAPD
ncbi:MAG: transglycosylase domain-containing protein [Chloroflexaceae bacterium]|jgi:peptidoglycan glycosyltransferase|nr:transglycosylase domain-containing protein [Chloroflexaceae bacterium]